MYRFYERLLTICIITALCLSLFQIGHILVLKNALWISVQNIRFDKNEYLIFKGDTIHLTAVAEPLNATNKKITLHSTKDSVAIVNQKGIVTAIRVGTCEIIAEAQDGSGSNAICTIIVKDAIEKKIPVSELVINKLDKEEFCKGDSISLSVKVCPENATDKRVDYCSTDENVAKENADGKVNMQGEGECRIIVEAAPRLVEVHVPNPKPVKVTSIVFDKSSMTINIGDKKQIVAKVLPADARNKTLQWKSDNEGVATVNNGVITGKSSGNCTISASSTDGGDIVKSIKVRVQKIDKKVTSIVFDKSSMTINIGDKKQIVAKVLPTGATNKTLRWKSDNESVASVSNGIIQAISKGTCVVKVMSTDGSNKSAKIEIKVIEPEKQKYSVFNGYATYDVEESEITITRQMELDLHRFDDSSLKLNPGDKILRVKVVNGYLKQGEIQQNGRTFLVDGLNNKL